MQLDRKRGPHGEAEVAAARRVRTYVTNDQIVRAGRWGQGWTGNGAGVSAGQVNRAGRVGTASIGDEANPRDERSRVDADREIGASTDSHLIDRHASTVEEFTVGASLSKR